MTQEQPNTASKWKWFSGSTDEWFANGPFDTRNEAVHELDGYGGYITEAIPGAVTLNAKRLLDDQYFEADDLFSYEDGPGPDRRGDDSDIKAADAELQALLDDWLDRWRHTFVTPTLFAQSRNTEQVPEFSDEAAEQKWLAETGA